MGFVVSTFDLCLFINKDPKLYILLLVDDMFLTGVPEMMDVVKKQLSAQLAMRFLGPVRNLLGIELIPTNNSFVLSQRGYAQRILQRFGI